MHPEVLSVLGRFTVPAPSASPGTVVTVHERLEDPTVRSSDQRLDAYLRTRLERALSELASIDPDVVLAEDSDVAVAALMMKHLPSPVEINWDTATRTPFTEVTTQVRDQFARDVCYTVPASMVTISFPIEGTAEMLHYQASTYSLRGAQGKVTDENVVIEITEHSLTAESIRAHIDRARVDIDKRAAWANADLAEFRSNAGRELHASLDRRRERILNDRAVEESLGIPVRTSSTPHPPVPARRRQVSLERRREQARFVPEPILKDDIYQDVVQAVRAWATSLERTPGTTAKQDEEALRDLLLGNLNTYWQGAAGGELFNGSGKTDVLIRHDDRNVFIAECKIWQGPKSVTRALDQLLGYLVWRDSKAALIMFIKTKDPNATISKLHTTLEDHPSWLLTKSDVSDSGLRGDYVIAADDEGRRVSLAVIPVVIRSPR